MKQPCVYILASDRNGTPYTGVTSDLVQRVWQLKLIEQGNPHGTDLYEEII